MRRTLADLLHAANEELIAKGNAGAIAEYFAPGYVAHIGGRAYRGHRFVKRFLAEIRGSFSKPRVEVEILMCRADRVAWRRTIRAKHDSAFKGFPVTVTTREPYYKKKPNWEGTLVGRDAEHVSINLKGRPVKIPLELVEEVRLPGAKTEAGDPLAKS